MMGEQAIKQEVYKLCKEVSYDIAIGAIEDVKFALQMEKWESTK